jgi:hypothetical protein
MKRNIQGGKPYDEPEREEADGRVTPQPPLISNYSLVVTVYIRVRFQTNPDIGASHYPLSIRRPDRLAGRADEDEQFGTHSKPWNRSDVLHRVAAREAHEGGCAVGHRR